MQNVLKRLKITFPFLSYGRFYTQNSSKNWPILNTKTTILQNLKSQESENWCCIRFSTFSIFHVNMKIFEKKKIILGTWVSSITCPLSWYAVSHFRFCKIITFAKKVTGKLFYMKITMHWSYFYFIQMNGKFWNKI